MKTAAPSELRATWAQNQDRWGSVAPMAHPLDMAQRLGADEVSETDRRDDHQRNSGAVADGFYTVPRVIE